MRKYKGILVIFGVVALLTTAGITTALAHNTWSGRERLRQ